MQDQFIQEIKQLLVDYEEHCEPCEEETRLAAIKTGRLATLAGDDLFAPDLLVPPKEWFYEIPDEAHDLPLKKIYIFDDGRVAGRVADWDQCILDGSTECWRAPKLGEYGLFHQSTTELSDGSVIATADLAVTEGHAPVMFRNDWQLSLAYNSGDIDMLGNPMPDAEKVRNKVARVRIAEQNDGLWVLGAIYPTITARQVVLAKSTPWSGHWGPVPQKGIQFLGVVPVNSPGLPQLAKVASYNSYAYVPEGTQIMDTDTLVAAATDPIDSNIVDKGADTAAPTTSEQQTSNPQLQADVESIKAAIDQLTARLDEHEELITSIALQNQNVEDLVDEVQEVLAETEGERIEYENSRAEQEEQKAAQ